ncbi:MAG: winged helix-turn-helix domain-containing protein [Allosphingosinicella sp.]
MELVAERSTTYAFDRFTVDREDERLFDPDGPVRLGNKAFQVLLKLLDQNGRLVTKDMLMSSVWDGTIVSESALTSVIKELRRALGDDARTPRYIESVYGRGYRLLCRVSQSAEQVRPRPAVAISGPFVRSETRPAVNRPFHPAMTRHGARPSATGGWGAGAAGSLALVAPGRQFAASRRLVQRALSALFVTTLIALAPTGLGRNAEGSAHPAAAISQPR